MRCSARACPALSVLLAACAPPPSDVVRTGPALPGQPASTDVAKRRDRNRITAEELDELRSNGATDMYALIQRARPNGFHTRREDVGTARPLILYDDPRLNTPGDLRGIPSSVVQPVEYISPPASLGRYGTSGQYGVIMIRGG